MQIRREETLENIKYYYIAPAHRNKVATAYWQLFVFGANALPRQRKQPQKPTTSASLKAKDLPTKIRSGMCTDSIQTCNRFGETRSTYPCKYLQVKLWLYSVDNDAVKPPRNYNTIDI